MVCELTNDAADAIAAKNARSFIMYDRGISVWNLQRIEALFETGKMWLNLKN